MKQPEMKYVKECEKCRGSGEIMGLTMRIFCPSCHGNRFESVPPECGLSVSSLSKELYEMRKELAQSLACLDRAHAADQRRPFCGDRYRDNTLGPGGSKFVGD